MPVETIVYLVLGSLAGGFVNGLAGTGTALFALGFFLNALDPLHAVAVVASLSAMSGFQGMWEVRQTLRLQVPRIIRFVIPGLMGVPLGIALLSVIDAKTLKLVVAGMLIFYGGYFGFRTNLPKFERRTPKADVAVGFIGGVMGGAASLSGALPVIWCSMRPWSKAQTRSVLQTFNTVILGTTVTILALRGAYGSTTLKAFIVVLPVGSIAVQIGLMVFRRLSDDMFRRVLILLCLLLGVGLLIRSVI